MNSMFVSGSCDCTYGAYSSSRFFVQRYTRIVFASSSACCFAVSGFPQPVMRNALSAERRSVIPIRFHGLFFI